MTNSRDWENGGPKPDRRGERESPLQQERNVMTRKLAIGIVVLITGVVMLNDHEALARGGGGFGLVVGAPLGQPSTQINRKCNA